MQIIYNIPIKFGGIYFDSIAVSYLLFVNLVIIHALKIAAEDFYPPFFYGTKLLAAFFLFVSLSLFLEGLAVGELKIWNLILYLGIYFMINLGTIFCAANNKK